ncbi:MAG TPA: TIGR03000 domain-containing protein [Vicinamibacterales bacterium]|nr:TIGR03000 domain-containing protein [Vicinamibacterales bacterium]
MKSILLVVIALVLFGAQAAAAQTPAPAAVQLASRITVAVPNEQTDLVVDGKPVPGVGYSRSFETPPLEPGATYRYTFTATWQPNTYTTMTRSRLVSFRAGDRIVVDLTTSDPADRVRVAYVPTPPDIAAEMIKLAGVNADDVVFEPGCGDARITIAAVKAGAKRGVGIDIDPERVADARAAVDAAGLARKIEIRLDDALEIHDLSTATVVFLYMGDHFNLLMRPILWKQLEVGTRVVSHRFKMGDWQPDKTVTVTSSEGIEYELHLWTVTEEVKRKLQ